MSRNEARKRFSTADLARQTAGIECRKDDGVIDETPAAIAVAKTALQSIKGETIVFVRTENGFEARKITTGRQDARLIEVTAGLAVGERVATGNTFVLKADLGKAEAEHAH